MNSGKTFLSTELARIMNAISIDLDDFLISESTLEDFYRRINTEKLKASLNMAQNNSRIIFISGICLLDVMRLVCIKIDFLIYVKRVSYYDIWHDGFHLEKYNPEETVKLNLSFLHKNEYEYHLRVHPHLIADVIYKRIENFHYDG